MVKYLYYSLSILVISVSLQGQLIINSSGDFTLGTNISGSTGIVISASNVNLNLNQQTVSSSTNAIEISAGVSNVTICNGTISTSLIGLVINQNCSNIFVQNLLIQNCTTKAIQVVGSSGNLIQRCNFKNIAVNNCFTSGISSLVGIDINFAQDLRFENINFANNGISTLTQLTGVSIQNSERCILNDVQIKKSTGTIFMGVSCGASTDSCVFDSCLILNNTGVNVFIGFLVSGITATNHFLNNCIVANNMITSDVGENRQVLGFQMVNALGLGLLSCQAYSNVNPRSSPTAICYGFYLDRVSQSSIVACQSFVNRATGNADGVAGGFFIGTTDVAGTGVKNCGFFNNLAFGNVATNGSANSYGFNALSSSTGNVNNTYINNKGIRNGTTVANQITSSTGGVPLASITARTIATLNTAMSTDLTNIRVT